MRVSITFDSSQMDRAVQQLGDRAGRAIARALNRAATSARTTLSRDVAKDLGLKVGDVRDRITVTHARAGGQLEATLRASSRRLPLMRFGARQTRRGVTAKVRDGRKRYDGTF